VKYLALIVLLWLSSCKNGDNQINSNNIELPVVSYHFESYSDFHQTLDELTRIADPIKRDEEIVIFLDSMKSLDNLPFAKGDSVSFLYYGDITSVSWAGDFNYWSSTDSLWKGTKLNESNLFLLKKTFPSDARLDYKIVVNGNNWILDPLNNHIQYSGFGPNSELRMPEWVFPEETELWDGVERGEISENIRITSGSLGYDLQYRVYTPYNYESIDNLPTIYVTDGHEYADGKLGAMRIVLDNLIYRETIEPVIAVFIDPRDPDNLSINRRMTQYVGNSSFAGFVSNELVPTIDQNYKTFPAAEKRAILGTSLGGWNSAYFGIQIPETFHLIGIHSPAFTSDLLSDYENSNDLPHKFYLSTGTVNDTEDNALALKAIFDTKGYTYQYKAVNQGHSWGNWCGLIDEPLIMFFPNF
jgi:enterochelin esterase family protein